jgi:putative mycofactocin binding protein MftB
MTLSSQVGLRPEPFGALAYHFDTRRLVFLKSPGLVALVESLSQFASADEAIAAADAAHTPSSYQSALTSLEESGVVCVR